MVLLEHAEDATTRSTPSPSPASPAASNDVTVDVKDGPSRFPLPPSIDCTAGRFPFCVVWTPIPWTTALLPFVGHVGICDSQGHLYDFQNTGRVRCDRMLFGAPTKYWDVSRQFVPTFYKTHRGKQDGAATDEETEATRRQIAKEIADYDATIARVAEHYRSKEVYHKRANNCQHFVADAMNEQVVKPTFRESCNLLYFQMFICLRFVGVRAFLKSCIPTLLGGAVAALAGVLLRRRLLR